VTSTAKGPFWAMMGVSVMAMLRRCWIDQLCIARRRRQVVGISYPGELRINEQGVVESCPHPPSWQHG